MEKVIAFFQRADGVFERYEMFRIDYDDAASTRVVKIDKDGHPDFGKENEVKGSDFWSLEPPPEGAKVIDKVPKVVNALPATTEITMRPAPPIMVTHQAPRRTRTMPSSAA